MIFATVRRRPSFYFFSSQPFLLLPDEIAAVGAAFKTGLNAQDGESNIVNCFAPHPARARENKSFSNDVSPRNEKRNERIPRIVVDAAFQKLCTPLLPSALRRNGESTGSKSRDDDSSSLSLSPRDDTRTRASFLPGIPRLDPDNLPRLSTVRLVTVTSLLKGKV